MRATARQPYWLERHGERKRLIWSSPQSRHSSTISRLVAVLAVLVVSGAGLIAGSSTARADIGSGYKYADAVCEFTRQVISPTNPHCVNPSNPKDIYDWGYFVGSTFQGSDPWGYEYRNCTSYVAWRLWKEGVNPQLFSELHNADQWLTGAATKPGVTEGTTPELGAVAVWNSGRFGHVAFVESTSGSVTVSDYNYEGTGLYDPGHGLDSAPRYIYFPNAKALPSAPLGLTATRIGSGAVLLKWSPPAQTGGLPIDYYEIDTSTDGTGWNILPNGYAPFPDLREVILACYGGTDCRYKVAAVTDAGVGPFSTLKAAKNVPPGPPTALTVTRIGNNDVLLKWSPPADKGGLDINSYEIETSPNGKDWNVASNGTVLPDLPEVVLSAGTDRWYKVAAVTDGGYGSFSTVTSVQNTLPGAPTIVGAPIVGDGQLLLKWSPPAQTGGLPINSYEIETSTDGTDWNILSNGTALPDLPEAVFSCSPGTGCQYKVAAVTDAGYGPFSQVVLVHMPPNSSTPVPTTAPSDEAPSPPTGLSAQRVAEGVLLQWSPPANAHGLPISSYEVYLSTNKGRDWTRIPPPASSPGFHLNPPH